MIEYLSKNRAKLTVNISHGGYRKRKSKTVTFKTKRELEKMYREFEDEVRHNPLIDTTVRELIEMYIKSRKALGLEATTIKGYETTAERIYSRFEGIKARETTSYQVQAFVNDLGAKYSPKTIRNTVSLLSAAYDNAVRLGQLQDNPCSRITLPKKEQPKIDIFDTEQIRMFLGELNKERLDYKVAYELALFCGLRRSEILGLKEDSVNLTFKCVTVSQTRHRLNGEDVIQGTKTETSHRTLALPDFVVEDITALIEEHQAFPYRRTDFLVQDGFGNPMTPSALTSTIYRIESRAGLPNVSLHDLRHTFASMLNNGGVDIAMISKELGHSSIGITLAVYTHVFGDATKSSRDIADKMEKMFAQNKRIETESFASSLPLSPTDNIANA